MALTSTEHTVAKSCKLAFQIKNGGSDIKEIAPQVYVKLIFFACDGNGFSVSDNSGKDTDNLTIGDAEFTAEAIISANDVTILIHAKNTVNNVITVRTFIKWSVVFFKTPRGAGDDHNVLSLTEKRHHTHTFVGMKYHTVFFKLLLEGDKIIHR